MTDICFEEQNKLAPHHSLGTKRLRNWPLDHMKPLGIDEGPFRASTSRPPAQHISPSEMVVIGEITEAWHQIGQVVEAEMRQHTLARTVRLMPAYDGASARLRSAATLVFAASFRKVDVRWLTQSSY
jgi:hypothetical protein